MGLNYSDAVYEIVYNYMARAIIVTPYRSIEQNPVPYTMRGIYRSYALDVLAEDGSVVSDQRTELDIREDDFLESGKPIPIQGDVIEVPEGPEGRSPGIFQVKDSSTNAGGETTLALRKFEDAKPL